MSPFQKFMMKTVTRLHVWLYRTTSGAIGAKMRNVEMLLLTTTGRKSGQARTVPLLFVPDGAEEHGGALVVVGSKAGAPKHPAWYLNLTANPEVTIQHRKDVKKMTAETVNEEDKARLWPLLVTQWPDYANYQKKTDRPIPVIRLTPVAPAS